CGLKIVDWKKKPPSNLQSSIAARLAAVRSGLWELALPAPGSERNVWVAALPGPGLDWEQALLATLVAGGELWWPGSPRALPWARFLPPFRRERVAAADPARRAEQI